ncbi:MAG: DUF1559 domain-containing protein [Armatimonadota bacterium]|jgi:prepilin-type N-terminal cleavage/methylation domain-containing protein/prepilin-type processing-associated H-X9-DG protein
MRRRAVGFTLIELLVVIAIIAILASILFPVFSRARAKARQAACISNSKQIVLAFKMYTEDFDEMLPLGQYAPVGGENGLYVQGELQWYDTIFPYVRNSELYRCTEMRRLRPGYGMNDAAVGASLGAFYDASIKILTADMLNAADPTTNLGEWAVGWNGGDIVGGNVHVDRHNEGCVYGFLDGHVKWHREAAVKVRNSNGDVLMWDPMAEPDPP